CMASIVAGADGALYYTNDSGNLFALKGAGKKPVDPVVPGTPGVSGGDTSLTAPGAPGSAGGAAAAPAATTTVAPSSVPVSALAAAKEEKKSAVEGAGGEAVPLAATGEARARDGGGVGATGVDRSWPENTTRVWALAGLAVGGMGLVGVAGYLLRARRIKLGLGGGNSGE
ncbi:MAG: hypothetical protein RR692_03685, partial [Raoultibacter sp.]